MLYRKLVSPVMSHSQVHVYDIYLQSIESQLAQEKIEVDHLQELLAAAKEKAAHDKEALKKATR